MIKNVQLPISNDTMILMASPMKIEESEVSIDTEQSEQTDSPWSVIVWNDPINLMDYVELIFMKIFGYSKSKANKLMLDVHNKGRANVYSGEKVEAEKYVHKLHSFGLWATMEQN